MLGVNWGTIKRTTDWGCSPGTAPTVLPVHGTRGSQQDKLPGPEDIPGPPAGHEC